MIRISPSNFATGFVLILTLLFVCLLRVPEVCGQQSRNEVEAGVNYRRLTAGFPSWQGAYLRLVLKTPSGRDTWFLETLRQREFGDTGTYFSAANSHTINDDWYAFLAVGGASGGFFLPDVRIDAQLNRKWLARKQLVTTFGAGYYDAKTSHHDASVFLGGTYYFKTPWVVQSGVRWNRSMPGEVVSRSQFVALSQGREREHYFVVRGETGREAYQVIGPQRTVVNFPSHSLSVTWKQWLGEDWGFNGVGEYYESDIYKRTGLSLGIFKAF